MIILDVMSSASMDGEALRGTYGTKRIARTSNN